MGTGVGDIIISAPNRTARGILLGPAYPEFDDAEFPIDVWYEYYDPMFGDVIDTDLWSHGGEVQGLESPPGTGAVRTDAGIAYLFNIRNLWEKDDQDRLPPKPHQYMVGQPSHISGGAGETRIPNIDALRVAGGANEKVSNIQGIPDFNGDGRNDFAVGASRSERIYIAFRRETGVEGDYVLEKLELDVNNSERLSGALITGESGSQFAFSMASDVDLNGDDVADLVVGAPGTDGSTGEVYVIFSSPSLITGANGTSIDTLVSQGRAARITGRLAGDFFGFNVASAGDLDGDGKNDLLIAAPGATPYFDSDPFDDNDILDTPGLDLDQDGLLDNVTGPNGVPETDQESNDDFLDELHGAGLVYVIWGTNVLTGTTNIANLGGTGLEGAIIVGHRGEDPTAVRKGDSFGGGDAGDPNFGGNTTKQGRGRSRGLRSAGDVDGDGFADILIGSVTATPRIDPESGEGATRAGEAYLIYGFKP